MPAVAFANNLSITNVSLTDQNTTNDYIMVEFDISWENSWRTANLNGAGVTNWDAVWLFIKYRKVSDGVWRHAILNATPANHSTGTGTSATISQTDNKGVFLYRSGNGTGAFSATNVQLRWDYGSSVGDAIESDIKVFGIEMVYVPQGNFRVGDGSASKRFHQRDNTANSLFISSEDALRLGNDNSTSLWATGSWDSRHTPFFWGLRKKLSEPE